MIANVFLVKSAGGWFERQNSSSIIDHGRREARLDLGALKVPTEINRVADAQLLEFAYMREELTHVMELGSVTSARPHINYREGDVVNTLDSLGTPVYERILGFTGSVDNTTGMISVAPTVKNIILPAEIAVLQAAKKMIPGTVRGQSKAAQPVLPRTKPNIQIFTFAKFGD